MAKARALDKRRRSVRNIRKITRTMELIATARFKKAMDRASASTAYTKRITQLVSDLAGSGLEVSHPLLQPREKIERVILLVIAGNRGLCGGYNSNVFRLSWARFNDLREQIPTVQLELSGKRPIAAYKYRGIKGDHAYTHFEDKPSFAEVEMLANRYLEEFATGNLDRFDVAYTRFEGMSKQTAIVETLLPLSSLGSHEAKQEGGESMYEFLPSAAGILEEVVPTSFKVKLFKCFLDSAVSEQIARKVAMKSATDNADKLIKSLGMQYNRARQSQITSEIMEVLGGVEALKG
ncbi:MAG: ATP synthase F1 subunit gamma [Pirellulales bacterium]|nr:ATP synthase F1 subunit gamma [Pirellulales bacterium]